MSDAEPRPLLGFSRRRLWVMETAGGVRLATWHELRVDLGEEEIGVSLETPWDDERSLEAVRLPDEFAPSAGRLVGIRSLHALLPAPEFRSSGRALQLLEWYETHRFCGRCGTLNRLDPVQRAMVCPACGLQHFPRVAPAIIVLIHRKRQLLLGRSPRFPEGVFSTIAGFVEPGESLEEAVRREVFEETGVTVAEPAYFGSQPWPFPHSLMVGFLAGWDAGDIVLHDGELEEARWFDLDRLPLLPTPMSIARWMIDAWLARFPEAAVEGAGPPPEAWDR